MSLVTRCPACTTTFKVVRDQLRISDGWVRCGRCSHVFDATLDLHEAPDGASPGHAPPSPSSPSPAPQGGYMPGLVQPSGEAKAAVQPTAPVQVVAPEPSPLPSPPSIEIEAPAEAPASPAEDADFFDDDPESPSRPAPIDAGVPGPVAPPPAAPAFSLTLPEHGLAADEPWSDLDTTEPAWKPPRSTLPPFPNIDLNLASPPPAPPPAPPLPMSPRMDRTRGLIERASDDGEANAEREQEEKEHDKVQMQKALRRARAKSAKIAGAKARDERAATQAAEAESESGAEVEAAVVQRESEPDYSLSSAFELPVGHPLADEDEHADAAPGFWQRRSVRIVLVLLVLLAVLLLAVQVLRHERDGIAARQPNLRPALAMLCQHTGCELAALRQIGDIVIEGAAFAREKTGTNDYRLSFTLRNGATVPLAMPAVELSLLDTQERAVVRRVLMPVDYGAPSVLQARADRAASLPLTLSASEAAALPPIAGYRVEAFYP
jgi:predicted Zn finger-like uncharacterized protein